VRKIPKRIVLGGANGPPAGFVFVSFDNRAGVLPSLPLDILIFTITDENGVERALVTAAG